MNGRQGARGGPRLHLQPGKMFHAKLVEIVKRDARYPYEAYDFIYSALAHTEKMLNRGSGHKSNAPQHITGAELMEGVRDLALREFGLMARSVFRLWGIDRTDDFGEIVFNLVEAGLMSKTDEDSRADFHKLYDLDQVLVRDYRIQLDKDAFLPEYRPQQEPAE
jgi:uncharacterized repeat protein (TIGR04138 family)